MDKIKKVTPDNKPAVNRYVSKDGFVRTPTIRGIYEIEHLFNILNIANSFICGGYARYCMSPRKDTIPAIDIDIYNGNNENYEFLKVYFVNKNLKIRHENKISITFERPKEGIFAYHPPIQLIKPLEKSKIITNFTGADIEHVLQSFDFTVIRGALLDRKTGLVDADFMYDEMDKIIRIKNIHCPVSSTLRAMKYSKKGYYLPPTQVVKLMSDWENRDGEYREKIREFIKKLDDRNITQEEIDELEELLNVD